jgi:uncharacterized protein YndB with AHSA1/START domain
MDSDFTLRIGHNFVLRSDPNCGRDFVECTILEIQPLKRLAFSWKSTDDGQPTLVEIQVRSQNGGTLLTLRHTGDTDKDTAAHTAEVWPAKIARLREFLHRL